MKCKVLSVLLFFVLTVSAQDYLRDRSLESFSKLVVSDSYRVTYIKSDDYRVVIDTIDNEIQQRTITQVVSDTLVIKYDGGKLAPVAIRLYAPFLTDIEISETARFSTDEQFSTERLNIALRGAGSIRFGKTLECDSVIASLSGAGSMSFSSVYAKLSAFTVSGTVSCTVNGVVYTDGLVAEINGAGKMLFNEPVTASGRVVLTVNGTASIEAEKLIKAYRIAENIEGAGYIKTRSVEADRCDASLHGIGSITIGGTVNYFSKELIGIGRINTKDLVIKK